MYKNELTNIVLSDVSATSLITLYCRAIESQTQNPILSDPKAAEVVENLNQTLSGSRDKLHRKMVSGKLDRNLVIHIAIRAKKYDEYVRHFLARMPHAVVVNIGCGLDTRFWRIDNGQVRFYDLDFPEVIEVKKHFFQENERYHFISSSVLDDEWIISLRQQEKGPFLFVAEGVFMYLHEEDVKSLVLTLQSHFPGSELVCEVFNTLWLSKLLKPLVNYKMQKRQGLGKDAMFHFGIRESNEMEKWNSGIQFLDDWSYFDSHEKKLGVLRIFRHIKLFRKTQWTVHYRLN
jgi:methyltransferase (TIGR00027 family)